MQKLILIYFFIVINLGCDFTNVDGVYISKFGNEYIKVSDQGKSINIYDVIKVSEKRKGKNYFFCVICPETGAKFESKFMGDSLKIILDKEVIDRHKMPTFYKVKQELTWDSLSICFQGNVTTMKSKDLSNICHKENRGDFTLLEELALISDPSFQYGVHCKDCDIMEFIFYKDNIKTHKIIGGLNSNLFKINSIKNRCLRVEKSIGG